MRVRNLGLFIAVMTFAWSCGDSSSNDGSDPSHAGKGGTSGSGGAGAGGSSTGGASGAVTGGSSTGGASGGTAGAGASGGSGGTADGGQAGDGAGGAGDGACSEAKPIVITSEADLQEFGARGCEVLDGSLTVSSETLTSLDALGQPSTLRVITGSLAINQNPLLEDIEGIRGLEEIGGSLVVRSTNLVTLSGFESVRRVGADLVMDAVVLSDNPRLANVTALGELTSLVASLSVRNNPELTSLAGLDRLRDTSDITILGNALLAEIGGLTELEQAISITIASNVSLVSASFPNLLGVGSFSITTNPVLASIGLPLLASAENLTISGNDELLTVGTLSELDDVGSLIISGNPKLPQCFVDALDARLMACDMSCVGNDASATCN
jgi:hypothetical protein